jgi:hypothetical protein
MTIKQQGGVFGRNPTFNNVEIEGDLNLQGDQIWTTAQTFNGGVVINEDGDDLDFRVESDTLTHALFVNGANGNVGVHTSNPIYPLDVEGNLQVGSGTVAGTYAVRLRSGTGDALSYQRYSSGLAELRNVGGPIQIVTSTASQVILLSTGGVERVRIDGSGNMICGSDGGGDLGSGSKRFKDLYLSGNATIGGSLSKGSGSFKIDHPLKPDTHHLVHSFIEGPQADNIYRGKVALVGGQATVNLDEAGRMTDGTFVALNGNIQCFTTNEDGWTAVRGSVSGNVLTIEAQDANCTDTVSWMVIGERQDQHMIDAEWTDENGRVITEPAKVILQEE